MKTHIPKTLKSINPKSSGRNNSGKITVRHQGGRQNASFDTSTGKETSPFLLVLTQFNTIQTALPTSPF
jgi:ribosomal protein L2